MKAEIWDPWKEFGELQRRVDRLLNTFFRRVSQTEASRQIAFSPIVDVYESKREMVVRAAVPGAIQDDIDVAIEGRDLVIRGERDAPADARHGGYCHREWRYGMFERKVELPRAVNSKRVHATYVNGVLEVRLPLRHVRA